jgi:hypothetical protein
VRSVMYVPMRVPFVRRGRLWDSSRDPKLVTILGGRGEGR